MFTNFNLAKHLKFLPKNGRILIAPLNWGIGHATRCIPIINQLQEKGFTPIIASDGDALKLLQKVFPDIVNYELPSYQVTYAKKSSLFTIKLLSQLPKFIKTYKEERKKTKELVEAERIDCLISDNRFGVFNKEIPSIYISHQLRIKTGWSTFFSSKIHQKIIQNFDECWVPDTVEIPNLSGDLSHNIYMNTPISYIGVLSPLERQNITIKYDIIVLLSGPEPQRSILEEKLLNEFKNTTKKVCFVRGVIGNEIIKRQEKSLTIYNYLIGDDLQKVINESELVIARSGYSTIMDLAKLGKKAFFIPTPGQSEQIYLAKYLKNQKIANFSSQKCFHANLLEEVSHYKGFKNIKFE